MNCKDEGTRWAVQIVVACDRHLFRHFRKVAQWNEFAAELVKRSLTPVAWSKGEQPSPIGVMFDFRGLRARHCRLDGIDFTFCDLEQADLEGSSLKGAKLGPCPKANLRGTRLHGTEFRGNLSGADMTGANVLGADFAQAYFHESEPPLGLPPEAMAAIERAPEEPGDGVPDVPFAPPLRARVTIHEVPW